MGIKINVFGSETERRNYYKLSQQWGQKYRIYHNLPFLFVLSTESLINPVTFERLELSDMDKNRLKKTSIDYTLCDEKDSPILAIDFDGLQGGHNVGQQYHTIKPSDSWRKQIHELKLTVSHGSLFPYFIMGSRYFRDIESELKLMIVDGIIGTVLASKAVNKRINEGFKMEDVGYSQDEFDKFSSFEKQEIIQDWVIGIEVDADFENNPITRELENLSQKLGVCNYSIEFITYPEVPDSLSLKERSGLLDQVIFHGAKVKVTLKNGKKAQESVLLPNFKTPFCSELSMAEEIAHLIALKKIERKDYEPNEYFI